MNRPPSRILAVVMSALPLVVFLAIGAIGCPRDHGASDAGGPLASLSAPAPASAPTSSSAWKTVLIPDPPLDATVQDGDLDEAAIDDGGGDGDARDGRPDVPEDAPLMGTKTFAEEVSARGLRKITSAAAKVHKAPKDGMAFVSLPKGTEVTLIAEYLDWYRVKFTDPNSQQWRQGWIYIINFVGPRQKSCPVDWTHHDQDGGWCDRDCSKNTDCKALKGYKCSGTRCFFAGD